MKYTDDQLIEAIKISTNYSEVLRNIGAKFSGSLHAHIKQRIQNLGIDTSHFVGKNHKNRPNKLTAKEILVYNRTGTEYREHIDVLRRAMNEIGIKVECSECSVGEIWMGKRLSLQIDHINGDCQDNRPQNLRYLCPNCHTQTVTYGNKKNI